MDRKPTRFEIRLPPELADQLDAARRNHPDLPPRADMARKMMELALYIGKLVEENDVPLRALKDGRIRAHDASGNITDAEIARYEEQNRKLLELFVERLDEIMGKPKQAKGKAGG